MTPKTASSAVLSLCLFSLLAAQPAAAQSSGGPLRERLQNKVQGQIDKKAAQTRTQIEREIAARPSPAEIAQVRQVQTSLNYFTFDAGPVDGLMGQKTRSAIEAFQAFLDYPVTGELAESEAKFLFASYQEAQANSTQAEQVAATHPEGIKGLLLIFRDGAPTQQVAAIPNFRLSGDQQNLSAICAQAAGASASAGTALSLDQALLPLFCSATDAAIAQSGALATNVSGFTPAQIEEQCVRFEPALVSLVASVSEAPAGEVVQGAAEFVQRTGQDPAAMAGIAKVCLGVGYRRDQIDLATGSAVLLTALDAPTYAEYLGYHLALGVGAAQNPALAQSWFELAMQSETDAQSAFGVQTAERLNTLKSAMAQSGAAGTAQVPSFSVND